jgi:hypothetical protein
MKVNIRNFNKGPGERKIDVKVEPWDTYSMDHTAALIILPLLIQLKNTKHGVPNDFVERVGGDWDDNYCFDFIKDDENEVFDKGCKKWEETLDKMIWSFQQLVDDNYSDKYHHGQMKIGWEPIEIPDPVTGTVKKAYEMVDENPGEHWYDHVGHMLHEDRIQEGLELFGKYYRSLWD